MLIISRKKRESLTIKVNSYVEGSDKPEEIEIVVSVAEILGDKIKIGIDAPKNVKILRQELIETERTNKESAKITTKPDITKLKNILQAKITGEK